MDFDSAKQVFEKYLDGYDRENDKVRLKIVHTYGVVEQSAAIAGRLGLSQEDKELAGIIALLHDIGRFEQLRRFDSFLPDTMDHASYGVELLFGKQGMIRRFVPEDTWDGVIRTAIARHSDFALEGITDGRELMHARIIRDADKLDNCRVKLEDDFETFLGAPAEEVSLSAITPKVREDALAGRSILSSDRVTPMDYWVSYLVYFYDLNYRASLDIVEENDYVRRLIHRIPYLDPDTGRVMEELENRLIKYVSEAKKRIVKGEDKMEKYLGENIPKLGFGLMRLPMDGEKIDVARTQEMVDRFLEEGFCYFDTAYGYNDGESEAVAKKVLVDRYPRDRFLLATKLPAWAGAKNREEAERMFYTSLERTGAGYFDFYLLHNLGQERTRFFDDYDIWNFLKERKKEGLIRHLGFSMHDKAEALDRILTEHPEMEFVQLQINYADWEDPDIESRKCYETARKHGKPVIIMEPVKGGTLADPPREVKEILAEADGNASPSSWAIRFAASLDGVITVLSGMSNMEQMEDNLSYMKDFAPLSEAEQQVIKRARDMYASFPKIPCTSCAYCMKGCPKQIGIHGIFQAYNLYTMYHDLSGARHKYQWNTEGRGFAKASACIRCGKCEQVCPQHIHIRDELARAAEALEG